ncbi:hypothetical protein [Streptomyces zaomyceticus]|uniref:hypothetical protein n=1 Tax=Streptomyces zaomyceticus TaxID=68286 RepID=UPI002E2223D5
MTPGPYPRLRRPAERAWALGATLGFTGVGRPGVDPEYTGDPGIRLYDHGVDVTAVLAVLGMLLALAPTRPRGRRLPRLPPLALGWAGLALGRATLLYQPATRTARDRCRGRPRVTSARRGGG